MSEAGSQLFVAVYSNGPEREIHRQDWPQHLSRHIAYQQSLHQRGILLMGGPFRNRECGMALMRVDSLAAAREIVDADPLVVEGSYTVDVWQWEIALGSA